MKISFIGLGVMGFPMAGHLAQKGWDVSVFNRTQAKAIQWAERYSGRVANSVAECVQDADVVLMCVGNDDDVRSMTTSDTGALGFMKPGAILVDHTTTSAVLAEELYSHAQQVQVHFMDAPVSGGQSGAENGILIIMCGGDAQVFETLQPVFQAYGQSSVLMGKVGQGQRAKMVNQVCVAGVLRGLSEGLAIAQASDLDIENLINCLKNGAAGSWQMENRTLTMAQNKYDFGFAIDWMIKDLGICLDEAKRKGIQLKHAEQCYQDYVALSQAGEGRMDTSILYKTVISSS